MTEDTEPMPFRIVDRRNGTCAIEYPCNGTDCAPAHVATTPRPGKWHTLVAGSRDLDDAARFINTAWRGVVFTTNRTGVIPPQS